MGMRLVRSFSCPSPSLLFCALCPSCIQCWATLALNPMQHEPAYLARIWTLYLANISADIGMSSAARAHAVLYYISCRASQA